MRAQDDHDAELTPRTFNPISVGLGNMVICGSGMTHRDVADAKPTSPATSDPPKPHPLGPSTSRKSCLVTVAKSVVLVSGRAPSSSRESSLFWSPFLVCDHASVACCCACIAPACGESEWMRLRICCRQHEPHPPALAASAGERAPSRRRAHPSIQYPVPAHCQDWC